MSRTNQITWDGQVQRITARDSQRLRVYRAEWAFGRGPEFTGDLEDAQEYVDMVLASESARTVLVRCHSMAKRLRQIRVARARAGSRQSVAHTYAGRIELNDYGLRSIRVILHEVAHVLVPNEVHHHWPWVAAMLELTREHLGEGSWRLLRKLYREHGARWAPPKPKRVLTPEEKAEVRARFLENLRRKREAQGTLESTEVLR